MNKRRFVKRTFSFLILSVCLLSFAMAQESGKSQKKDGNKDLYDIISTDPELSKFFAQLKEHDLADTLRSTGKNHTILAPVNSAFTNMSDEKKSFLFGTEDKTNMERSLLSHFIKYDHDLAEFLSVPHGTPMKNLAFGKNVIYNNEGIAYIHDAKIIGADIKASNGTIQKVDQFILFRSKFD